MTDNFFTPVANTKPYFKIAFEGFAGTGKTYTAALVAVGLHKRIGSLKPVIMFDTEKAAGFLKKLFADNNIPLLVRESHSLADLKLTMQYMREGKSDVLIIDSISHVWEDFLRAYSEKVKRTRLQFQDWGIIKPTWKTEFSEPFVRDPYHIFMCGRAGYEYVNEINEETKQREIYKSGVKMRAEGELAYEPDVLVLMERYEDVLSENKEIYNQATVLKDRSTLLQGKTFKWPTYEHFAPVVETLLTDPVKIEVAPEGNAALLFRTEEEKADWKRERDRWLEEIEGLLTSVAPGQSSAEKKFKVDALFDAFATTSWVAIQQMQPEQIKDGYEQIRGKCLDAGLVAYNPDMTIAAMKKIEVKDDPKIEEEIKEKLKKSKAKTK